MGKGTRHEADNRDPVHVFEGEREFPWEDFGERDDGVAISRFGHVNVNEGKGVLCWSVWVNEGLCFEAKTAE